MPCLSRLYRNERVFCSDRGHCRVAQLPYINLSASDPAFGTRETTKLSPPLLAENYPSVAHNSNVMKNITVSIDDDIYLEARVRAARLGTSVSALVKKFLESMPEDSDSYLDLPEIEDTPLPPY